MYRYRFVVLLTFFISIGIQLARAQDSFKTTSGRVEFNASTPLEDIKAINENVNAIFKESGDFAVVLLIREFEFRRKLMQEHFNENYLESDTYPKSYFLGKIEKFDYQTLTENAKEINIVGKLSLHGVTRNVTVPGSIGKKNGEIILKSNFIIRPEDYDVEIPTLMFKKIAREVEVSFSFQLPRQ